MAVLYLVPNVCLPHWKKHAAEHGAEFLPMSVGGLAAQILKDGLFAYQEDDVLAEIAVWQAVQVNRQSMKFFTPIANYPGFIQELQWLFAQIDLGEDVFQKLSQSGTKELMRLHQDYHSLLQERGVLDYPGQLQQALQLSKQRKFLPEVKLIQLRGLSDLHPLERKFLESFAQDRPIQVVSPAKRKSKITVKKALDPQGEIEMIGQAIRRNVEGGIPLEQIGMALVNPQNYQAILFNVFGRLQLPWRQPAINLQNTVLGKAILILLRGELQGWHKHHLQLLTSPGWGFPFELTATEHRLLRLGPPHKGLPAWREYLGSEGGWEKVLKLLVSFQNHFPQSIREYGFWLEGLLEELKAEQWIAPEQNFDRWAELVKAWSALQRIARSLQQYDGECNSKQFFQLLQKLLSNYKINPRRIFQEQLQVFGVEQIGGRIFERLHVGGLVEDQFSGQKHVHWLTKLKAEHGTERIFSQLLHGATEVCLYYPEVDGDGKLNLPSTFLPEAQNSTTDSPSTFVHYPSLFLTMNRLEDHELLLKVQKRLIQKGLTTSDLNRYANCPYQFFCAVLLELKPEEEVTLELDAREKGSILHEVLRQFWSGHLTSKIPSVEFSQTQIEGLLRAEYLARGESPSAKLIRQLRWFIRQDILRALSGFRPRYLERRFQGLVLETTLGPVRIRGQIDRIDEGPDNTYVLYDYKSGTTPSIDDILKGRDLQIAVYLLAAQVLLPSAFNVGVAYYPLQNARPVGLFDERFQLQLMINKGKGCLGEEDFKQTIVSFREKIQKDLEAMLTGVFPIQPAGAWSCRYCAFQGICRKEVAL